MPYFIILPAYALLLVFLTTAAIITRYVAQWRSASGWIVGGTIGSLLGFILANVLITLAGLLPVWISALLTPPEWLQTALGFLAAATFLIGPFVASALGVAIGFATGALLVLLRRRKRRAQSKRVLS